MQRFSPSNNAIKLITTYETCNLTSELVSPNLYKVGYKHVGPLTDKKITKTAAVELLKSDIVSYGISVYNIIKKHKLDFNQDQFDALVDIYFDLEDKGVILNIARQDTIAEAAKAILDVKGNRDRRKADYDLFTTGKISSSKATKKEDEVVEDKKEEVKEVKKTVVAKPKKEAAKKETTEKKSTSVVKKIKEAVEKKPAAKKTTTKKKTEEK